jgi:DNA polymerase III alpha subunit
MRLDKSLNPIYTENEAVKVLLNDVQPWDFCVENKTDIFKTPDEDEYNSTTWWMPEDYEEFNIEEFLLNKAQSEIERNRIIEELNLYKERDLINLLRFLKYFVDKCKENNIALGIGRGSSVGSFCLYLLGVHKVNSIKYNLDIKEFLR